MASVHDHTSTELNPDRKQIDDFINAIFRHAGLDGFASVRSFYEGETKPFRISPVPMARGLSFLCEVVEDDAYCAANSATPVVFCPVLATFTNGERARQVDLLKGLALSVECDQRPGDAAAALQQLLGPATVIVRSGGTWTDPATGEVQDKMHVHYRLNKPAQGNDLLRLKQARDLATMLVGGDTSNKPVVHPIRCPGSWHRKAGPRLCQIEELNADAEIDLDVALEALTAAAPKQKAGNGKDHSSSPSDWAELIKDILTSENYHDPLVRLAMKMLRAGMNDGGAVNMLRALMENADDDRQSVRWQVRYNDIPRAISTARGKCREASADSYTSGPTWRPPKNIPVKLAKVADFSLEFLPPSIAPWVGDISERLQCPLDYVAVTALTALGALIGRRVGIKPQQKTDWLEVPNLWGAFIGKPGMLKSPAMMEALKPLHHLEAEAAKAHAAALVDHQAALAEFKLHKSVNESVLKEELKKRVAERAVNLGGVSDITNMIKEAQKEDPLGLGAGPEEPKPVRYRTNDSSYEAIGALLVSNPSGLLVERDELVSLLKHLDREEQCVARGFYMSGWSGAQPYTFDRITRGHIHVDAVCIGLLGNTQPTKIAEYVRRANADGAGGDGLIQRFGLLVWPDEPIGWKNVDEYPDKASRERVWGSFERISKLTEAGVLSLGAEKGPYDKIPAFRFDEEASGQFLDWRTDLEKQLRSDDLSPALEGHVAKYRKLVPALALIDHLAEHGRGAVGLEALLRALSMVEYLETHARRVYGAANAAETTAAEAILTHIRRGELKDGFTARDVHQRGWSRLTEREHVQLGLNLLVDLDHLMEVTSEKTSYGGRPRVTYLINPASGGQS